MIFENVSFFLSPSLLPKDRETLANKLSENGASPADSTGSATHIITNSDTFEDRRNASENAAIVTPQWVFRSLELGAMLYPQFFSACRNSLFSGVVGCAVDLTDNEKDLLGCAISQLGGQWRAGLTKDVTHLFAWSYSEMLANTTSNFPDIRVVIPHWFDDCLRFFALLPVKPYLWPNPPVLLLSNSNLPPTTSNDGLTEAHKKLLRLSSLDPDVIERLENGPPQHNTWDGKRILLGVSLDLRDSRRIAFERALSVAGAQVLQYKTCNGNGSLDEEASLVKECDIFVTRYREGRAYEVAVKRNKAVGSIPWLLYVQATGARVSPRDQLLHYPVPKQKVEGLPKSITVTNYTGEAREYIKRLISTMGGEFTPTLSGKTEVLIAASTSGEKVARARAWSLPIVNHLWLEDSFANWQAMAMTKQRYINFPSNVDFSVILAIQGLARLPTSIDCYVPSSDGEEGSEHGATIHPSANAEPTDDDSLTSPQPVRELSPPRQSSSPAPLPPQQSSKKTARSPEERHPLPRSSSVLEQSSDSEPAAEQSKPRTTNFTGYEFTSGDSSEVEDGPETNSSTSDSGLEPPGRISGSSKKKGSSSSTPAAKKPAAPKRTSSPSTSRPPRKKIKATDVVSDNEDVVMNDVSSNSGAPASESSSREPQSTQKSRVESNQAPEIRLGRRSAAQKAQKQLVSAAADMMEFQRELRRANFNRAGSKPADFVPAKPRGRPRKHPASPPNVATQNISSKQASTHRKIWIVSSGVGKSVDGALKEAEAMGARINNSKPQSCTHLILHKYVRTIKVLRATTAGPWIVTENWLLDSVKAKRFLPEEKYLLRDPSAEAKYDFKMSSAVINAKKVNCQLFRNKTFWATKRALGEFEELVRNAVEGNGGKLSKLMSQRSRLKPGHDYVVAADEAEVSWVKRLPLPLTIYTREIILDCAMRQEWREHPKSVLWRPEGQEEESN